MMQAVVCEKNIDEMHDLAVKAMVGLRDLVLAIPGFDDALEASRTDRRETVDFCSGCGTALISPAGSNELSRRQLVASHVKQCEQHPAFQWKRMAERLASALNDPLDAYEHDTLMDDYQALANAAA